MATKFHSVSNKVRMCYDDSTGEYGLQISLTAGATIAKGNTLSYIQGGTALRVSPVPTTWNENELPMGIAYAAATSWNDVWVWINWLCQILPESDETATLWYNLVTSTSEAWTVTQSASVPVAATHFREVGHWAQSGSGNGALTLAIIHFN